MKLTSLLTARLSLARENCVAQDHPSFSKTDLALVTILRKYKNKFSFLITKVELTNITRFVLNESFRDTNEIHNLVKSFVEGAKINRHYGRELSYILPRHQVSFFPSLFSKLESLVNDGEAETMGFSSYGVSMTTLEEVKSSEFCQIAQPILVVFANYSSTYFVQVFLKLGEEAELAENAEEVSNKINNSINTK